MSELRLPVTVRAGIIAAAILLLALLINMPGPGGRRPTIGGGALEVVTVFVTLGAGALAPFLVVGYLVRPMPLLAVAYSWTAFGVLVGDVTLLVLGYQIRVAKYDYGHYALATTLLVVSAIALLPALIAQASHGLRRRS